MAGAKPELSVALGADHVTMEKGPSGLIGAMIFPGQSMNCGGSVSETISIQLQVKRELMCMECH